MGQAIFAPVPHTELPPFVAVALANPPGSKFDTRPWETDDDSDFAAV